MNTNLELFTLEQFGTNQKSEMEVRRFANHIFFRFYNKGHLLRLWARLIGKTNTLRPMRQLATQKGTPANRGVVTIPLDRIVGSESRSEDFDGRFYPLHTHNKDRWVGIFVARRRGITLPVVELIQDGNAYYIRDGHHRISVAKAIGQREIAARIVN